MHVHKTFPRPIATLPAAVALLLLSFLVVASSAFGDAADVKIPPNQHPTISATAVENLGDGHAGTPADPHTVTVTVTGGWSWPTHGSPSNCNIDRAGTGVAVAWFDPQQQGNPLGNTDATAATVLIGGVPTPIFVGVKTTNSLNLVDNVVHPTENDIGTGAVVDIATPADFANWRGSCGVFTNDVLLNGTSATVSHGNFGRAAPGDTDTNGQPFNAPVPPAGAAQRGALLTHTYRSKADVTRVCAVTYDVHGDGSGKKAGAAGQNGVGIPGDDKPVTAGGSGRNDDNGVEANQGTPLGNACPAFFFPSISTQAGAATMFAVNGTASISDTATLSGADPTGGGNLIFKAYGPQADPNNYTCNSLPGGNLIGSSTVPVSQVAGNINHSYPSGSIPLPAAAGSGDYVFTVEYQPTAGNTTAISGCNDDRAHETATVNKRPTTLTTDAGSNVTLDPVNGNDLTDTATLSGGTTDGTGTITFTLFKDSNNGGTGCDVQIGTATATVNNGADGKAYVSSPAVHVTTAGQYHWTASYGGDGKNAVSSAACGDNKENPIVFGPTISTQATGGMFAVNGTVTISDVATLSGADPTGGGNLVFKAFGPQANPNSYTCTSGAGGNQVGTQTVPVTQVAGDINHDYTATLSNLPLTTSGDYVFTVTYEPTAGNAVATSGCNADRAHETAPVTKRPTTLTTDAGSNVTLDPVNGNDLTDTATLSGGTSDGTGTITFKLFKDSNDGGTGCDVQVGGDVTKAVTTGADGDQYTSPAVHVSSGGQYHWTASYDGDGKNSGSSAACGDNKENPIVFAPSISTQATGGMFAADGTATISDVATLSGADPTGGGNLVFKAFGPQANPNSYTCTSGAGGNQVGTQTVPVTQVAGDINHDYTATLSNLPLTTFGDYVFTVTYEPTAGNAVATSGCNADRAHETAPVTKRPTTLTTDAGSNVTLDPVNGTDLTDTATLSGGTSDGTGTITFKLFKDSNDGGTGCDVQVGGDVTKAVTTGADGDQYTSPAVHVSSGGQYHWTASYDGDGKNSGSSAACGDNKENPIVFAPTISTQATGGMFAADGTVTISDLATLSGADPAGGGNLVFKAYGPQPTTPYVCDDSVGIGNLVGQQSVPVTQVNNDINHGYTATLSNLPLTTSGNYVFTVTYEPTLGNAVATSGCNADRDHETAAVTKRPTTLTTDAGPNVTLDPVNGNDLTDTATLSGGTTDGTGTITFKLFKDNGTGCDVQVGGDVTKAVTTGADNDQYTSPAIHVSAGGQYHWTASYDGDGKNSGSSAACGDAKENPKVFAPSISTQATGGMFAVNGTVTISDVATLSGADPTGGGNLVFKAFGPQANPNSYTCTSGAGGNEVGTQTVPVTQVGGDINHNYTATLSNLPLTTSGDYVFTVTYEPTAGNAVATSGCNADRAHETAPVSKRPTTLTTDAGPNVTLDPVNGNDLTDTATVSGGTSDGTGTITFKLFKDSNNGGTGCDVQVGGDVTKAVNNGADGKPYTSPAIHVSVGGQYHWTASYDGDGKNSGSSAACGDNKENPIVFAPSISTQATGGTFHVDGTATISDVATLSGADPTGGGNLVFKAFGPQANPNSYTCTSGAGGNEVGTQTVPVTQVGGDINHDYTATLSNLPLTTFGNYVFTVTYEPTAGNAVATSGCNADRAHETATVNKRPTSLTTDAGSKFAFDPVNGNDLTDTATLSGGTSDGTGTITFKLFKDNGQGGCAAQVGGDVTKAVNNGADGKQYTSPSIHVTDPGQYHWTASYDGDGKNAGSSSACGADNENPKVITSGIHVVKSGDDHVYHDDTMHFSYVVTNTGGGPLSSVTVSDDKCPNVQGPTKQEGANDTGAAFLDPGDVWTYTCQTPVPAHSAGEENPIVNTATAGAQDEFQRPVSDTDQHSTRILHPAIAIDKTGPLTATQGDLVPYTLTVTIPDGGDESFAANTVVVTDRQCAPPGPQLEVKNRGAGLDPSPGTLDPGDSWVYTCSVQSTAGQARIDNVADVNAADEFGHPVSATDTASTVLGQIVQLPEVTPGTARLAGASGCVARSFVASVRGKAIRKVVFSIDGKRRASVSKPDSKGRYKLKVDPRKFSRGSHLLVAKATFDPDSGTKTKTMSLRFSRCVRRAAPAFTG